MICRILVLLLLGVAAVRAQVDDLADDPWNIPQWDAMQVYRDAPLCLRCVRPTELTVLPGIGRATASRIRRVVDAGVHTMDAIADSACLSVDQRIMLASTTTLECTCGTWFESARTRMRSMMSEAAIPDLQTRVDVVTQAGRLGGLLRSGPAGDVAGAWAVLNLGPATLHVGDLALQAGLGLVHGGGGGFGRGPLSRARAGSSDIRLRPWTSTWHDASQRGIGVHLEDTLAGSPVQAAGYWSQRSVNHRLETTAAVAAATELTATTSLGLNLQHLGYTSTSTSSSMTIMPQRHRTLLSLQAAQAVGRWQVVAEGGCDDSLRPAWAVVARMDIDHGQIVGALRWAHADLRNPYAAPISSASGLGNESGFLVGMQWRRSGWAFEGSLDLHQRPSRSYGSPLPSRGLDLLIDGERRLSAAASIAFRARYESNTEGWRPDGSGTTRMLRRDRSTLRAEVQVHPRRDLRLRVRGDVRHVWWDRQRTSELGTLLYADVRWTMNDAVTITGRHTMFASPGIDAAPYTLESPLVGLLRTVAGSGTGTRQFISVRYAPRQWISCSAAVMHERRNAAAFTSAALQVDVHVR